MTSATARAIYSAIASDVVACEQIRARHKELALEIALSKDAGFEATSFSLNGQSFTGNQAFTKDELLERLHEIITMLDLGGAVSPRSRAIFQ